MPYSLRDKILVNIANGFLGFCSKRYRDNLDRVIYLGLRELNKPIKVEASPVQSISPCQTQEF